MCGIIALLLANPEEPVFGPIYNGLVALQHRGQDAAGIMTATDKRLYLRKKNGLASEVFRQQHASELKGHYGIGHVRYPTAGSSSSSESQPFYSNNPCGLCIAHNGNLTNTDALREQLSKNFRHVNTDSDSEMLINIFGDELFQRLSQGHQMHPDTIFDAVSSVHKRCSGSYAVVILIKGVGILAFRDPFGIRPLCFGTVTEEGKVSYCVSSESVAIDVIGFTLSRDIAPGEAILFTHLNSSRMHSSLNLPNTEESNLKKMSSLMLDNNSKVRCQSPVNSTSNTRMYSRQCSPNAQLSPCIFEYAYFARPDSILDGVSVYQSRLEMGARLAREVQRKYKNHDIDVVMPIPDTGRAAALQCAYGLGVPFREGFIKNRYIARTFIMPNQRQRELNIRRKLNTLKFEMAGKNILFVDDSIVRGTTSKKLVMMARNAGAKKVYFASAAPAIRYPNVYGIDMPVREELIAYKRNEAAVAEAIGADWMIYLPLDQLEASVLACVEDSGITSYTTLSTPLSPHRTNTTKKYVNNPGQEKNKENEEHRAQTTKKYVNNPGQEKNKENEEHRFKLETFDTSSFSGKYVTGDIDETFFENLEETRTDAVMMKKNQKYSEGHDVVGIHNM